MNTFLRWIAVADDRMNPVAVKESRQAVQSRWVVAILTLFLVINLTVIGGYLMLSTDSETSITGGRDVFAGLMGVLVVTCIAFVPLYSGVRLSLERSDVNVDLLFISTITPAAIVRGKYLNAMALTLLMFSACMPFMVLTYLLRGIDLPTIFYALAWSFLVCAVANAMGIFAGSIPGSWFIRGVVAVVMVFQLFYLGGATIALINATVYRGWFGGIVTWSEAAWLAFSELLAIGLLHVYSVALLSPKTSNRMFVPRICVTCCWALFGAAAVAWALIEERMWPVQAWTMSSGIAIMFLLVAALGERDSWSYRVRRTIPRNPLSRLLAFVFYSGAAGGMVWCTLLFVATIGVAHLIAAGRPSLAKELFAVNGDLAYVFGYALCYCLTIAALRPVILRRMATPGLSVLAAFLGIAVCLGPYLVAFFIERDWWRAVPWYLVGSPMVLSMSNEAAKNAATVVLLTWLGLGLLAASPWALGQWRRFESAKLPVCSPAESVAAEVV